MMMMQLNSESLRVPVPVESLLLITTLAYDSLVENSCKQQKKKKRKNDFFSFFFLFLFLFQVC